MDRNRGNEKQAQAEKASTHFQRANIIPNLGQRVLDGFGPGRVHVFPDGSVAMHGADGCFLLADVVEG